VAVVLVVVLVQVVEEKVEQAPFLPLVPHHRVKSDSESRRLWRQSGSLRSLRLNGQQPAVQSRTLRAAAMKRVKLLSREVMPINLTMMAGLQPKRVRLVSAVFFSDMVVARQRSPKTFFHILWERSPALDLQ
jgi:hypothetical protein